MGLRVLAIRLFFLFEYCTKFKPPSFNVDTGEAKREMVPKLGAEKWVDLKEDQELIRDI